MDDQPTAQMTVRHPERGCGCKSEGQKDSTARDILDRRYAGGEITREQYEQIKQDLGTSEQGAAKKACC